MYPNDQFTRMNCSYNFFNESNTWVLFFTLFFLDELYVLFIPSVETENTLFSETKSNLHQRCNSTSQSTTTETEKKIATLFEVKLEQNDFICGQDPSKVFHAPIVIEEYNVIFFIHPKLYQRNGNVSLQD